MVVRDVSYFDYPLEQGLRQIIFFLWFYQAAYFDYPLEQGLRREGWFTVNTVLSILIIH